MENEALRAKASKCWWTCQPNGPEAGLPRAPPQLQPNPAVSGVAGSDAGGRQAVCCLSARRVVGEAAGQDADYRRAVLTNGSLRGR